MSGMADDFFHHPALRGLPDVPCPRCGQPVAPMRMDSIPPIGPPRTCAQCALGRMQERMMLGISLDDCWPLDLGPLREMAEMDLEDG